MDRLRQRRARAKQRGVTSKWLADTALPTENVPVERAGTLPALWDCPHCEGRVNMSQGSSVSPKPEPGAHPAHWEADILLADGETARLRPLGPSDESALRELWERLTPQSQYFRFFSPHRRITPADLERFLHADQSGRVVLGVFARVNLIAIGEFTRTTPTEAELAFLVDDAFHGYGVGGLLLEHLAQIAREIGLLRLSAQVLPDNRRMLASLRAAGYEMQASVADGLLHYAFPVEPTDVSQAVMSAREHRAEANSMRRIFEARSVAIVGGSAKRASIGRLLLTNFIGGDFTGRVHVVNAGADALMGMPSYNSVRDIPDPVDLVVIVVPAERIPAVIEDCAAKDVHAALVISTGFAEADVEGRHRQRELVEQCHAAGIRLIGPGALGMINAADTGLNASLCDVRPRPGRIGFFCQSGPVSLTALRMLLDRGLGLSSFVSAGNQADVSGNDLLQYWEQDEATQVILCYLESVGNVHKFSRLARRISATKPIVAMTPGESAHIRQLFPGTGSSQPGAGIIDAMLRQSGVIQVGYLEHLLDVAALLTHQPLPPGNRLAIVGDSPEVTIGAADMATHAGFVTQALWQNLATLSAESYAQRLAAAMADDNVDAVIAVFIPTPAETKVQISEIRAAIAALGGHPRKPLLAVIPGGQGDQNLLHRQGAPGESEAVPIYRSRERAMLALSKAWQYAQWRDEASSLAPLFTEVETQAAAELLDGVLAETPQGRRLSDEEVTQLLGFYRIPVLSSQRVSDLVEAVDAAAHLGWDVVLKATGARAGDPSIRRVWTQVRDANEMAVAWRQLGQTLGDPRDAAVVVQTMGAPGRNLTVSATEDRLLGPVVSCRMGGEAARVMRDVSYRLPPLTRADITGMLRELRLAPLLFGDDVIPPADVAAVEELIARVAQLKQSQPDVDSLEMDVIVHAEGISVAGARVRAQRPEPRYDLYARRLSVPPDGL